ncbi:MAG: hypothetical protein HYV60_13495 [Planctomycetia bacterium]|nr:hypothetical protein [Planctomycetia bacterium]
MILPGSNACFDKTHQEFGLLELIEFLTLIISESPLTIEFQEFGCALNSSVGRAKVEDLLWCWVRPKQGGDFFKESGWSLG